MAKERVIQACIDELGAKVYLEIGVFLGNHIKFIKAEIRIGVDPLSSNPLVRFAQRQLIRLRAPGIRMFMRTSDDYFEQESDFLRENRVDVALIDGAHTYRQAPRDAENCLNYLNEPGIIILHDCNPLSEAIAYPADSKEAVKALKLPEKTPAWSGDVWKAIVHLRSTRKDLSVFVLDRDHGLGVVTKGVPEDMLDLTIDQIEQMTYQDLSKERRKLLNLKEPDYMTDFLKSIGPDRARALRQS